MRRRHAFVLAWALATLVKLAIAVRLPLFVDEAFYWQEGQHLAWAYSDLPGLSAWLASMGDAVAPGNVLALRLPFLLMMPSLPVARPAPASRTCSNLSSIRSQLQ